MSTKPSKTRSTPVSAPTKAEQQSWKAAAANADVLPPPGAQIIADANRYQVLKAHCFNRTVAGFDGPVLTWTLTMPACEEDSQNVDAAVDLLRNYHGGKPFYQDSAPAEKAGGLPDLLPPMGIRNDRDMLNYLMVAFDNEIVTCERCGHSEPTKNMDSASFLRDYLAAAPNSPNEQPAVQIVTGGKRMGRAHALAQQIIDAMTPEAKERTSYGHVRDVLDAVQRINRKPAADAGGQHD